ncbi:MAG: GNAT family N-acetyltransferase [Thermoanaerobaculia bacterium]
MAEPSEQSVVHNQAENRFEIKLGNELAVTQYRRHGSKIIFTHTEVPPSMEGKGIGNLLARTALDYARREKLRVVPRCEFIAAFIERHPEYRDLVYNPENAG